MTGTLEIAVPGPSVGIATFGHSGDLGDVIYALPTIKALGGGMIHLYPSPHVREPFGAERAANLGTLLSAQPYVGGWRFDPQPMSYHVDFGRWRNAYNGRDNIAYTQAAACGIDPAVADVPWLSVPPCLSEPYRVVVARSHRYRNPTFPWALVSALLPDAVCVGTPSEYEELKYHYRFERYAQTRNLLQLAVAIANADLVITNQTCAYAIAEGFKKRVCLERWEKYPNVDFQREGVYTDPVEVDRVIREFSR